MTRARSTSIQLSPGSPPPKQRLRNISGTRLTYTDRKEPSTSRSGSRTERSASQLGLRNAPSSSVLWILATAAAHFTGNYFYESASVGAQYAPLLASAPLLFGSVPCLWTRRLFPDSEERNRGDWAVNLLLTGLLKSSIQIYSAFGLGALEFQTYALAVATGYSLSSLSRRRPTKTTLATLPLSLLATIATLRSLRTHPTAIAASIAAGLLSDFARPSRHTENPRPTDPLAHLVGFILLATQYRSNDLARISNLLINRRLLISWCCYGVATAAARLSFSTVAKRARFESATPPLLALSLALMASYLFLSQNMTATSAIFCVATVLAQFYLSNNPKSAKQSQANEASQLPRSLQRWRVLINPSLYAVACLLLAAPHVDPYFAKPYEMELSPSIRLHSSVTPELKNARTSLGAFTSRQLAVAGLHPSNASRVGDWASSPFHYFGQLNATADVVLVDIDEYTPSLASDVTIVGGGALLAKSKQLDATLTKLLSAAKHSNGIVIGWSLGFGDIFDPWPTSFAPGYFYPTTPYIDRFQLLSVRDKIPGYSWVPCVSAMAEAFDFVYPTQRPIGYYKNDADPALEGTAIPSRDSLSVRSMDLQKTIEFLGTSETVLTTSYHGAYWATLLGRKVIALDRFSRTFDYFPWPPTFYSGNLEADLKKARSYPHALDQARTANLDFWAAVQKELTRYR